MPNEVMEKMKGYSTYKESGLENTGTIPEDWSMMKLRYLTHQIIDGTHYTPEYQDNGIPFLRVTNIHTKEIDLSKVKYITLELHQELTRRCKPEKGDLLLSKNGTIGVTRVIDWDFDFSIFVSLCLIKFKADIYSPQFFSYLFQSQVIDQQLRESSKTTTVTNLHLDKISELFVVKPSLPEQHAIATFLDRKTAEIDELISAKERKIELLGEYRASLINQAVTKGLDPNVEMKPSKIEFIGTIPKEWGTFRCAQVFAVKNIKKTSGEINLSVYRDYGVIRRDSRDDNQNIVSEDTSNYKLVEPGDFVFNKMKCWQGSLGISEYRGIVSPSYTVCKPKRHFHGKYFHYLLRSHSYVQEFKRLSYGVRPGQWELRFKDFKDVLIPYPSLPEQVHVANFLDHKTKQIDELRSNEEQTIKLLKEYRQSLISAVVTGKIDVRNEV